MTNSQPDALRAWFRLMRLEARMRSAIAERLREVDLSVPQCDVLTTLSENEGVSQQELAQRLYVTKGNISGLIDRLAAAGLVERRAPPNDRRSHAIYLTSAGRAAAKRGVEIQMGFVDETLGRLDQADLQAFYSAMGKARELTRQAQTQPDPTDQAYAHQTHALPTHALPTHADAAHAHEARADHNTHEAQASLAPAPPQPAARKRATKPGKAETSSST